MRRSKIKPSINLASRRSVSVPTLPKDRGNTGTNAAPNPIVNTNVGAVIPKPSQDREIGNNTSTRERKSSQNEKADDMSNKEVISEVVPPSAEPLKDTTKQLDSINQPTKVRKDSDDQSTNTCISKPAPPTSTNAPEAAPKTTTSAIKRKRFSAVPNLGQPRLRPTGQRSDVPSAKPSTADSVPEEQKENGVEASAVIKKPPPVQRLTSVPSVNKKNDTLGAANTTTVVEAPSSTAPKSIDVAGVQNAPKAASVITSKTSDQPTSGDVKTTEVDGKRGGPRANVYSKKLKELKDQIDEETPSKRRKRHGTSNNPALGKMTMSDLIYYNPKANPMKVSEADKQNKKSKTDHPKKKVSFASDEEELVDKDTEDDSNANTMAPQVKIGPDGEIIIDQSSLYIQASPAKTFDVTETEIIHEDSSNTTYSSFRKKTRTATWTDKENQRFYTALSAVGTDFTTMNAMFPARTRAEIKRKFKKEEKINHNKVATALSNRTELDMSLFDPPSDEELVDKDKTKKKTNHKDKKATRKTKNVLIEDDDDSEVDDVVEAEVEPPEAANESRTDALSSAADSQDEAEPNLANILSTTRSGRQPKLRTSYTIQIPPKLNRKRTRASPRDSSNALKVFDDYAKHRVQLQDEHEATLTLKRLARSGVARDPEEESEDGRSDITSEMISEVGSEIGSEETAGVDPAGQTTNLQQIKTFLRNSPSAGPSGNHLGGVGGTGSTGGFSSPESISDPSVKKVTLKITTPDGKQTVVQVNLAAGASGSVQGQVDGTSPQLGAIIGRLGGLHALSQAGSSQMNAGNFRSPQTSPQSILSPARTLTTLANVSSPYQRASPQSQKIRTVLSTGETQPSKQSRNVTAAKIVDGKIVLCSPSQAEHTPTRTLQDVMHVADSNPLVHYLTSPHPSHQPTSFPSGQTPVLPHRTFITNPKPSIPTPGPARPSEAPPIPIIAENISTDPLPAIDSLNELDMSMAFAENLAGDLGMVAYEESIETMGDHTVAQQVNVASTNADDEVPRPKRKKQKELEPFIPPIK